MKISEQFYFLKDIFDINKNHIEIPESRTNIYNLDFASQQGIYNPSDFDRLNYPAREDSEIAENRWFKYPVFVPAAGNKYHSAIILLHGLNERNWYKHLAWARFLCEFTGKPVIMFPISFHMNRSLPEWTDRNEIVSGLQLRHLQYRDIKDSSFVNLILSQRLTDVPQRFFFSGYQSALDIMALINQIKTGNHPVFRHDTSFDIFSYSIGVFLAECMMIANPENIFDRSKFVFFAGGSLFEEMNGVSKYIMDNKAFERIFHYYLKEMDQEMNESPTMRKVLKDTKMGKAFRSMISFGSLRNFREKSLKRYKSRILCIPLLNDKVIPSLPTADLLKGTACRSENIKIMDFRYPCIHENPFPVNLKEYSTLIDEAFIKVFSLAGSFLA